MTVLLDANILLDFLQRRPGFVKPAAALFAAIEKKRATGYVAGHTITTIYYILRRSEGAAAAVSAVSNLLEVLEVVPVQRKDFVRALALGWRDFEDAVQAVCADKVGADYLVTRNLDDFRDSPVPAHAPSHVLRLL
ncbi:PIN domain-containing protein [Longimicrobium sp.]|uniref:PIN domain-containing protein n=1 Tax=Longimicrobium sp. TaxID=2029185 RepID=UPI003B3B712F